MSRDMVYEDVPKVSRREGDNLVAGQSNSTILLGRDRMGGIDSGYGTGKEAGAMHLIVGRKKEDPQLEADAATVYLSAKTDPDDQAGTGGIGKFDNKEKSGIVMRADCLRIVPRTNFKISVGSAYITMTSDGNIVIDGDVQLGEDAADRIIRGDKFATAWASHVHPTPSGPSGPTTPLSEIVFSPKNKVG